MHLGHRLHSLVLFMGESGYRLSPIINIGRQLYSLVLLIYETDHKLSPIMRLKRQICDLVLLIGDQTTIYIQSCILNVSYIL